MEKKKYSNEFLARVYGAYMGCECIYGFAQNKLLILAVDMRKQRVLLKDKYSENSDWLGINEFDAYPLSLRLLSKMTDDHAIDVAKILNVITGDTKKEEHAFWGKYAMNNYMLKNRTSYCIPELFRHAFDYLRSQGYDCGYGDISSLIEAGIAIEKQ